MNERTVEEAIAHYRMENAPARRQGRWLSTALAAVAGAFFASAALLFILAH